MHLVVQWKKLILPFTEFHENNLVNPANRPHMYLSGFTIQVPPHNGLDSWAWSIKTTMPYILGFLSKFSIRHQLA
jgi:hypothetical protein